MCGWVFFRPRDHVLFLHTHSIWPLFFDTYIYIYKRTSSRFSSHILIIVDTLEAKLGNSHILPVSREWVNGNTTVTCKWVNLTYFRCFRNAFVADVILLVGRRGPCFINVISFHPIFLRIDLFRWLWLILLDPRYVFLGRIRRKGGGGTKSSLNSLVITCINSIPCFCWSVSLELLF